MASATGKGLSAPSSSLPARNNANKAVVRRSKADPPPRTPWTTPLLTTIPVVRHLHAHTDSDDTPHAHPITSDHRHDPPGQTPRGAGRVTWPKQRNALR